MLIGIRGTFLDFTGDPFFQEEEECTRFFSDGLLVIENGHIIEIGNFNDIAPKFSSLSIHHYPDRMILPGFIDAHVHYSQIGIIGSFGKQLLDWLETYVYPEEAKYVDPEFSRAMASLFLDQLLRNGTTTAAVFATVHPQSVNAFFSEADKRNMRMIAGKVMMDREAPQYLLDTPTQSFNDTKELIQNWHRQNRQLYAVTPRFGITCTADELRAAENLKNLFPDVYIHTHIAETHREIEYTLQLFPQCSDYLEVYESFGLVTPESIFAHGIHLSDSEFQRLSEAGSTIAFCPSSNMFLGSGLFPLFKAKSHQHPVPVAVGSDVGAGTSLSLLKTLNEAYKASALLHQNLSPLQAFYLITLGAAKSLSLDHLIGNFEPGKEADLVVLNPQATPLTNLKYSEHATPLNIKSLSDHLFTQICLGDDRSIEKTYIAGQPVLF
jgi:guanine deaminase